MSGGEGQLVQSYKVIYGHVATDDNEGGDEGIDDSLGAHTRGRRRHVETDNVQWGVSRASEGNPSILAILAILRIWRRLGF